MEKKELNSVMEDYRKAKKMLYLSAQKDKSTELYWAEKMRQAANMLVALKKETK